MEARPMTVREVAWAICRDWTTAARVASESGFKRSTVVCAFRALEAEGRIERRFTDGVGEEFRRIGDRPPSGPLPPASSAVADALREGPMTMPQLCERIPQYSQSGVRAALLRLELRGIAEREKDREPHLWRLARWHRARGGSMKPAEGSG